MKSKIILSAIFLLQTTFLFAQNFGSNMSYAQNTNNSSFKVSPYIAISKVYNKIDTDEKVYFPVTMSGIDVIYSFGNAEFKGISAMEFNAGVGIYHFSDDLVMGARGYKALLAYKFSQKISRNKKIFSFLKATGQLVLTENDNTILIPRVSVGFSIKGFDIGAFGEIQTSEGYATVADNIVKTQNKSYSAGIELTLSI